MNEEKKSNRKTVSASNIAKTAIFVALSTVLYMIRIPLNFAFPFWLELQFSDFPALIGGFALGPVSGCIIVVLKVSLKLIIQGTNSVGVGDLGDILSGLAFVLPSSIIYLKNKTKQGAFIGMNIGAVCSVTVSVITNRFLLVPAYVELFYDGDFNRVVSACSALFKNINADNFYLYYLGLSVVPFNVIKVVIVDLLAFFTYKRISKLLNRF